MAIQPGLYLTWLESLKTGLPGMLFKYFAHSLQEKKVEKIKELFPFNEFFKNAPQPMFRGRTYAEDLDIAEGCFRHIKKMFTQLEVIDIFIQI